MTGEGKRRFVVLQEILLSSLKNSPLTINELAYKSNINWNTTSNQLVLLKGHDLVDEIFTHKRLRIFKISDKGLDYLNSKESKIIRKKSKKNTPKKK